MLLQDSGTSGERLGEGLVIGSLCCRIHVLPFAFAGSSVDRDRPAMSRRRLGLWRVRC